MKNFLNIKLHKATMMFLLVLVATCFITGCEDLELPGANSKPDTIPPDADFSYASDPSDFRIIKFTNLSTESLNYLWDFGDGNTSTEKDPVFTFPDKGTYPVTLTSTDGLGVSSISTVEVEVAPGPYQPIIMEPGFEDGQLEGGSGDGRDSWRNSDLGGVIQITGSPVVSGSQGAKLPGGGDKRIGYQEIVVEPETNYDINFIYTMFAEPSGYITIDILDVTANGGTFKSHAETQNAVLGSVSVNNQEDPEVYVAATVSFNSGTSGLIAIYFYNDGITESRLDDFTIEIGRAGAVPPSASFTSMQSEYNFLEYSFTNNSKNAASYLWDFGDGNTSTEVNPIHTYAMADVYTVKLTSTSEGGLTADFSTTIDIQDPVEAGFEYTVNGFTVHLNDTSVNAASVMWDFGDGFGASLEDPSHTYSQPGFYTITLTATSSTGLESVASATLALGLPEVVNGDLEEGTSNWKPASFSGSEASTGAFNGSSDGAFELYDGTPSETKTKGAKYTTSTTAKVDGTPASTDTRYAYQEVTLDPNTEYYIEFSYSIINDGDKVVGEILDGHFDDGSLALTASATSLVEATGTVAEGKGTFNKVTQKFTTGSSGNVSIWMWSNCTADTWFDNVKILPTWLVENQ